MQETSDVQCTTTYSIQEDALSSSSSSSPPPSLLHFHSQRAEEWARLRVRFAWDKRKKMHFSRAFLSTLAVHGNVIVAAHFSSFFACKTHCSFSHCRTTQMAFHCRHSMHLHNSSNIKRKLENSWIFFSKVFLIDVCFRRNLANATHGGIFK